MTDNLRTNVLFKTAIAPIAITDNTALVSAIIDTKGFTYTEFAIATGILADTDATFAVLVEDGDASNLSDSAAVPDTFLQGLESTAAFTFADDSEVRRIGYKCRKRYVRLTITPSGNSGSAPITAIAALSGSTYLPITQADS
jgi:hypothetical protein